MPPGLPPQLNVFSREPQPQWWNKHSWGKTQEPSGHACPRITHLLVPLVADFASHVFIQWEVGCNQHPSQKLWNSWKLLWLSPATAPGSRAPVSLPVPHKWHLSAIMDELSDIQLLVPRGPVLPGYFVTVQATLFKAAVSHGQITFQLPPPHTEGEYS